MKLSLLFLLLGAAHAHAGGFGSTSPIWAANAGVLTVTATLPLASSGGPTPNLTCQLASSSQAGCLSAAHWSLFNGKQDALTFGSISTTTSGVTVGSGANSTVGPNVTVNVQTATDSQPGLLSAADHTAFNAKQSAGNYLTALTSDVSATGPGSVAATVNSVGGSSASNVHAAELAANAATSANTANAILKRDSSGQVAAGTFTGALAGNSSTATALAATPSGCSSHQFANSIAASGNLSCAALAGSDLPNPSSSTLGGVQSYAAVSNQWIDSVSTSGVHHSSQPAFSNVSGTATETQGGTNQTSYTKGDTLYSSAANTLAKLAAGSTEQIYAMNASGVPYWKNPAYPSSIVTVYDDFVSASTAGALNWSATATNGGSAVTTTAAPAANPGLVTISTGATSATGAESIRLSLNGTLVGGGPVNFAVMPRIPTLSNGTDTFAALFGFSNTISSKSPASGIYFVYFPANTFTCTGVTTNTSTSVTGLGSCVGAIDPSSIQATQVITGTNIPASTTVSVAPGAGTSLTLSQAATGSGSVTLTFTVGDFWMVSVSSGGTHSTQVSSQAVTANTFYRLEGSVNAAGTSTNFTVNGTSIATITTNIPTGTAVGPNLYIEKSVGASTARTADVDFWWHQIVLTTAR